MSAKAALSPTTSANSLFPVMEPADSSGFKRQRSDSHDISAMPPMPTKNSRSDIIGNAIQEDIESTLSTPIEFHDADSLVENKGPSHLPRMDSKMSDLVSICRPDFNVKWAVASEKGYRNFGFAARQPIHADMEDIHWPSEDDYVHSRRETRVMSESINHVHPITNLPVTVFVLTDGHGGCEAPKFFVPKMRDATFEVMDSRTWNFDDEDQREAFEGLVSEVFEVLDKEYCDIKIAQYKVWMEQHASAHDKRPVDDGCTMVVNVLYNGYFVNCNVGDSRTVLSVRTNVSEPWFVAFSSDDHNMTHPEKIYDIHNNGGHFVNSNGTIRYTVQVQTPATRHYKPYEELGGARLFRPSSENIRKIGVSHKRTLNLTCTMGDLLFKVEPQVLRARPDVSFIKMEKCYEYIVVIATDGLWDHLRYQTTYAQQNEVVLGHITDSMDEWLGDRDFSDTDGHSSDDSDGYSADNDAQRAKITKPSKAGDVFDEHRFKLWRIAKSLTRRERAHHDLFLQRQSRIDDCTVYVIHLIGNDSMLT